MTRVAAIQLNAGNDLSANLIKSAELIGRAKQHGARVAVLPECFALMPKDESQRLNTCSDRIEAALEQIAVKNEIWIISAGVFTPASRPNMVRNTSFVHDAAGKRVARYDKIHLFDVSLGSHEQYSESSYTEPGSELKVVDTPAGKIGLTICYDVRFPELYRRLTVLQAQCFVVPSAFAYTTGRSHWEILLRARAVENFAYVVAPAQYGYHPSGRRTFGHSLIIDPWGMVLEHQADGEGVIVHDIEVDKCQQLRRQFAGNSHQFSEVQVSKEMA